MTEHPIFAYENVVVTPHLGASTAEAQDRAGVITAEQVVAALNGRPGLERGQHPEGPQRGPGGARALPAARRTARAARDVARRSRARSTGIEVSYRGHLAELDTRLLTLSVLNGAFAGRVEENVNFVNAPAIAEERGIQVSELKESESRDYANLVSVAVVADGQRFEVAGTTFGPRHVPAPRVGLRPELQHRAGAAPGDLPLLGRAGHDRQGRHRARRARHQHRLDRGRPRARPRARQPGGRRQRPPRRDGRDGRLAGARRGDRARSSRSTASRTAAPSRSRAVARVAGASRRTSSSPRRSTRR